MDACSQGHLMAATLLIGLGADLALLNNAGDSALRLAEMRVEQDDEDAPTAAQRKEHAALVKLLKERGAA